MAIFTKFLNLLKPQPNDYINVEEHLGKNYDKIDEGVEKISNEKLDKGEVSEEYNTAQKIAEKIKEAKKAGTDAGTEASKKLDKGSLHSKISDAKGLYDLIESNSGLNFDSNLLYLNDAGTKYVNKIYFDRNKKGLFKCISQTTSTTNSTSYFVDISNEANSAQLRNLGGIISSSLQENGYIKFSNGIVLQWGRGKTFPVAFPNKCLHVSATIDGVYGESGHANDDIWVNSWSRTGYTTYRNSYKTKFFAIGY